VEKTRYCSSWMMAVRSLAEYPAMLLSSVEKRVGLKLFGNGFKPVDGAL